MPITQNQHFFETYEQWSGQKPDVVSERYKRIIQLLKNESITTFLDLGANTGGVCKVILDEIPSIKKCYLVEPQIDNLNFLRNNFGNIESVHILPFGVYYGKDYLPMYRMDDNVGGYTAINYNGFTTTGDVMVCKTIEEITSEEIDFVKIDVEGSEFNIIENSISLKDSKFIEIELHPPYQGNTEAFINDYIIKYLPKHEIIDSEGSHVFLRKTN